MNILKNHVHLTSSVCILGIPPYVVGDWLDNYLPGDSYPDE